MTYRRILEDSIINYYAFQHYDENNVALFSRDERSRDLPILYFITIELIR